MGSTLEAYLGSKIGSSVHTKTLQRLMLVFGGALGFRFAFFD